LKKIDKTHNKANALGQQKARASDPRRYARTQKEVQQ